MLMDLHSQVLAVSTLIDRWTMMGLCGLSIRWPAVSGVHLAYFRIAVEFQNAHTNQVYITRKKYVSDSLPSRNQDA